MCFLAYFYWFKKLLDQFDRFISFILRFGLEFQIRVSIIEIVNLCRGDLYASN